MQESCLFKPSLQARQRKVLLLMKKLITITAAALLTAAPAFAHFRQCSFNGVKEACTVTFDGVDRGWKVVWHSDNKTVWYDMRGSNGKSVYITEDNGRTSGGTFVHRHGYYHVNSANGNNTVIPDPYDRHPYLH